jgi:hypothetical protein
VQHVEMKFVPEMCIVEIGSIIKAAREKEIRRPRKDKDGRSTGGVQVELLQVGRM